MSDLRKAVQDFLTHWDSPQWTDTAETVAAISVMRKALAETEQSEPFGYVSEYNCTGPFKYQFHEDPHEINPDNCSAIHTVYLHPPSREPLTDEQALSLWRTSEFRGNGGQADWFAEGVRAAEKHHGIKGDE